MSEKSVRPNWDRLPAILTFQPMKLTIAEQGFG